MTWSAPSFRTRSKLLLLQTPVTFALINLPICTAKLPTPPDAPFTRRSDTATLRNAVEMPILGVGTFQADEGGEVEQALRWALEIGYRAIDTASVYENEAGVGRAVRESGVAREDLFVTTKVWNDDQGYDQTLQALAVSLDRLQMDYVDLYLIHWPVKGKIHETWRALEKIYDDGRAKTIGVSNFLEEHLDELLSDSQIPPMVNQIEFHPHLQQPELVDYCRNQGIQVEAWSPLMKGQVFELPELTRIGEKHGKSPGQATLRWQLQRGLVTIPKSVKRDHLQSNAQVFDFTLTDEDMRVINSLDQGRRIGPDPTTFGFE